MMPAEAKDRPSVAPKNMQAITSGLAGYTDNVLFGDVWLRPELTPRDRSLVTLSALVATGKSAQLAGHLNRGLVNGLKPTEIAGMVTQPAFYTGWPNAVSALNIVEQVFSDRKIDPATWRLTASQSSKLPNQEPRQADEPGIARVSPKFAELSDQVLYKDLWQRPDLAPRDRSLVTIAATAANGDVNELAYQVQRGLANGLKRAEIAEAFIHLAFYAGWPKATAALRLADGIFHQEELASPETDKREDVH